MAIQIKRIYDPPEDSVIIRRCQHLLRLELPDDPAGPPTLGAEPENMPHNLSGLLVEDNPFGVTVLVSVLFLAGLKRMMAAV